MKQLLWFGSRLIPFILLAGVIVGLWQGRAWLKGEEEAREYDLARVAAILWVGTVTYRNDPEQFYHFRDSVLTATGYSEAELEGLMRNYTRDPGKSVPILEKISKLVDSISKVRQGIYKPPREEDSAGTTADSTLDQS